MYRGDHTEKSGEQLEGGNADDEALREIVGGRAGLVGAASLEKGSPAPERSQVRAEELVR